MTMKPYVVVVDDDPDDAEMLAEMFRKRHLEVPIHSFFDSRDAVEFLQSRGAEDMPVLLVTDYQLPTLNGAQFLELLQRDARYDPISKVVLSTSGNPAHADECLRNGAEKYLVKPTDVVQLEAIVGYLSVLFVEKTRG